jgi:hypothetical protein
VEWSSSDFEEEIELFLEDIDTKDQPKPARPAKVKNSRRAIEIIREQQQLRDQLWDFND